MTKNQRHQGRKDRVITRIWKSLCAATGLAGLACFVFPLQGVWIGVAVTPGLLVMLVVAVAWWAESQTSSIESGRSLREGERAESA